jgi:hypothetical protein
MPHADNCRRTANWINKPAQPWTTGSWRRSQWPGARVRCMGHDHRAAWTRWPFDRGLGRARRRSAKPSECECGCGVGQSHARLGQRYMPDKSRSRNGRRNPRSLANHGGVPRRRDCRSRLSRVVVVRSGQADAAMANRPESNLAGWSYCVSIRHEFWFNSRGTPRICSAPNSPESLRPNLARRGFSRSISAWQDRHGGIVGIPGTRDFRGAGRGIGKKTGRVFHCPITRRGLAGAWINGGARRPPLGPPGHALIPEISTRAYESDKEKCKAVMIELARLASSQIVFCPRKV